MASDDGGASPMKRSKALLMNVTWNKQKEAHPVFTHQKTKIEIDSIKHYPDLWWDLSKSHASFDENDVGNGSLTQKL